MLDTLTLSHFADKVNQSFQMNAGDRSAAFTLVKAEELPVRGVEISQLPRPPFSLMLTGGAPWAPQGTYTFAIPDLGEISLFIVPVGPTADGAQMQYQVIFN